MDTEKGYPRGFRAESLRPETGPRSFRFDSMQIDEAADLQKDEIRQENSTYLVLFKNIDSGELEATKDFLDRNPEALTAILTSNGDTPIHKAVLSGHIKIVEEIIRRIHDPEQVLKIKNDNGYTALTYAATGGIVRIAECLVNKCPGLVSVRNAKEHIPIVVASLYGHKHLVQYLYSHTPLSDLDPCDDSDEHKGKNGAMLVTNCIVDGLYCIALDLIQRYPKLAYTRDSDNDTAIMALAQTPYAFPSVPRIIRRVYKLKLGHAQAKEILDCICQEIPKFDAAQQKNAGLNQALFKAVENGIVEYIEEMMRHYPDIVWSKNSSGLNIFFYAVSQRQEKIFSLIYNIGAKKNILATNWDIFHNNMLHHAAYRAPASRLNLIPGAALQMQRELQWFKEVEKLVQPKHRKMVNLKQKKTPKALFTDQHKDLVEQGEKWMKETATSCTVVAALITTMMFSSAFTVPGGYRSDGMPLYIHQHRFKIFLISDAISLFTSCMSLLMFLGILKSRYREEDFLRSLPTKLIVGLLALFLSMATMIVTFVVTLMTLVGEKISWVSAQFMFLAVIPLGMFVVLQFPVLLEIFRATYCPNVFDKPRRVFKL
ncbi:Ankyrin repeat family protein [Arabidopsis thaliana]|uniref:Ankyrin repeat family protein n=1 Tax=Arabidopsis thaliana TaxID=3702 RepID=F4J8U1_ARATH|nr:Ankyrin repeat family protein [Arabidopsis thaliana]AEE76130.1 Ankyrin repeat family protein [Arabidopsis thaliana]|eukprot:NP_188497.1 Ankyrin repeat family protein [Arabidopsis thaliana]